MSVQSVVMYLGKINNINEMALARLFLQINRLTPIYYFASNRFGQILH